MRFDAAHRKGMQMLVGPAKNPSPAAGRVSRQGEAGVSATGKNDLPCGGAGGMA
jgi:hypothetical protein